MPHRTFAQAAKRRLVGTEGKERKLLRLLSRRGGFRGRSSSARVRNRAVACRPTPSDSQPRHSGSRASTLSAAVESALINLTLPFG